MHLWLTGSANAQHSAAVSFCSRNDPCGVAGHHPVHAPGVYTWRTRACALAIDQCAGAPVPQPTSLGVPPGRDEQPRTRSTAASHGRGRGVGSGPAHQRPVASPGHPHRTRPGTRRPGHPAAPLEHRASQDRPRTQRHALPEPGQHTNQQTSIACTRSFGHTVTDLASLLEAITEFTSRTAEKLRLQRSQTGQIMAFIRVSPLRQYDELYSAYRTI
jgi:hypothetical protein